MNQLRGWSRGLRKGVSAFYGIRNDQEMAYQLVKYRQRNGWTHRDVIRLAHPSLDGEKGKLALRAVGKPTEGVHPLYAAYEALQLAPDAKSVCELLAAHNLPWETIPTQFLNERKVWEALLPRIGLGALLRNLSRLAKLEMLTEHGMDETTKLVCRRFDDDADLKASRLHPITLLNGTLAYLKGRSERSDSAWKPTAKVGDTLVHAYMRSFGNVIPTGKNFMLALDVSGSMSGPTIAGTALTPREASVAMATITQGVEENTFLTAFSSGFIPLPITRRTSLGDAIRMTSGLPFDSTDCATPMLYAAQNKVPVDVFVIYTDNETFAGRVHPTVALDQYRQKLGRDAKLIVCGMTSTGFTIADPKDPRQLDVVGFSLDTPQAIASFAAL